MLVVMQSHATYSSHPKAWLPISVESLPSVPVQPLIARGHEPWGMFDHIKRYPWVRPIHEYDNGEQLLNSLEGLVAALLTNRVV